MPILYRRTTAAPSFSPAIRPSQGHRDISVDPCRPRTSWFQSSSRGQPAKWHLAHTSWFFETFVLREFLPGYQDFHPDFHWLFNSYYNSLGDMPEKSLRSSFSRPPLADILAYREHVDTDIGHLLDENNSALPPKPPAASPSASITSSSTRSSSPPTSSTPSSPTRSTPLTSHPLPPFHPTQSLPPRLAAFLPRPDPVGVTPSPNQDPADPDNFAFDNETPRHRVYLAPYSLATRLVTCAEYLAFMDQNAYTRPELWLSEGWTTLREQGWRAPLYWQPDPETRSGWSIFTLHGCQSLEDLSETPVCHLSLFEADAYARWAARQTPGCRLPTEFEWEYAASQAPIAPSNFSNPTICIPSPPLPTRPPTALRRRLGVDRLCLHRLPRLQTSPRRSR